MNTPSDFPWKQLSTKIVYENPWLKIREDAVIRPDGSEGIYGVIMTPPSVFIVAINDHKEIALIGQYRYPTQKYSWELPGGGSDNQPILEAAQRELIEETGYTAKNWKLAGSFQAMDGISDEICYVFIAEDLTNTDQAEQDDEGITHMKFVPFFELIEMILSGELDDGQSIATIMKAALSLGWLHD